MQRQLHLLWRIIINLDDRLHIFCPLAYIVKVDICERGYKIMGTFIRKIKKGIPKVDIQAMNLNMSHRLFLCFLGGIILGTLLLNLFMGAYASRLGVYSEYFRNGVDMYGDNVNKSAFFTYCIKKYIGECLVIVFLNITPIGKIFNYIYCIYKGAVIAMLISSATLTYGAGGLLLYIISVFPHYLLYVPFFVAAMYVGIQVGEMTKEKKMGKFKIRAVVVLSGLAVGTSFLEAYANYPILRIVFL